MTELFTTWPLTAAVLSCDLPVATTGWPAATGSGCCPGWWKTTPDVVV